MMKEETQKIFYKVVAECQEAQTWPTWAISSKCSWEAAWAAWEEAWAEEAVEEAADVAWEEIHLHLLTWARAAMDRSQPLDSAEYHRNAITTPNIKSIPDFLSTSATTCNLLLSSYSC